jgi:hypothetical protein
MYSTSDNLKTTNMSNLPSMTIRKHLNNIHIQYPTVQCTSITTVAIFNKTSSNNIRNMMYPVVFRLRRSQFDINKNSSINSIDGQKSRQRYGANHFLSRARLKTIKLTFIVVLTYILCSTPFYVGSIIMTIHGKFMSQKTMSMKKIIF